MMHLYSLDELLEEPKKLVLILVVMDDALVHTRQQRTRDNRMGLNPCCNGLGTCTYLDSVTRAGVRSLNPCCNG